MIVSALLLAAAVVAGLDWRRAIAVGATVVAPFVTLVVAVPLLLRARRSGPGSDDAALLVRIAGDLRSGQSLRAALAHTLGTDPVSGLGRAGRRARLGVPMPEVVAGLEESFGRHGRLVAASIRLVDRRGGSAVDALDAAAILVREDAELARELGAATAPARLSALVVGAAPFLLVALQASDGAIARTLALPGGSVMFGIGTVLVAGGVVVVFRLARRT